MQASIAIGCQAELRNSHPTASCSGISALIAWAKVKTRDNSCAYVKL
ncbi:hypothetical protein CDS [Bradyrhizobium sp.]|jgi:hypothetical protein|nr:hypothetical protein CDS [Bradyrhizobium sp.]